MHFKNINDLFEYLDLPAPENPLLGLTQYDSLSEKLKDMEIVHDFYLVCLKRLAKGDFYYGKTRYDSGKGFMYFFKPGQKLTVHDVVIKEKSFTIYIHKDYLMGNPLFSEIKNYSFFDYEINEALHLSPREKEIMWSLFHKIEAEYHNNPDEFSKSIILSHLDSMLKYAQRFYKRQFIDRKPLSGMTVTKFNAILNTFFESGDSEEKGMPSVNQMAVELNLSAKYLSDLLKQETGKTALELIHLHIISEAKNMLIEDNLSIAEISYKLGFENPPYFSRLFRKETGMSPREFKEQTIN